MHLLLAQRGAIQDGNEAIDLNLSPADVLVLSAADSDLASLAAAHAELDGEASGLRLANLLQLAHPMSVDMLAAKTLRTCKLVVARVLGGQSYWPHGIETLRAVAAETGLRLAILPGDTRRDPELEQVSNLPPETLRRLHEYLAEGGPTNARNFLLFCRHLLGNGDKPPEPAPLLKAGLWHPQLGICDPERLAERLPSGRPAAAIVFYRALVQSAGTEAIAALAEALDRKGISAVPVFVASLKDEACVAIVRNLFLRFAPQIVLNATGFAIGAMGAAHAGTVLDVSGAVVLQVILAGQSQERWMESSQGLSARDLAMNVALPEVDGRVLTRAIAFKHAEAFDQRVEANIVRHRPEADRIEFVADLAANWMRLRAARPGERRIAIVLANYPNRDGRIANGVGLDTPAGVINVLQAMRAAGYEIDSIPADSNQLMSLLQRGPTNAGHSGRQGGEQLSFKEYNGFLNKLPVENQNQLVERWGEPESDPMFMREVSAFALPVLRLGNVVVAIQPARGYQIDPKSTYHSPDLVPPHSYLAFHFWLRKRFGAHAVVHMGKHGNLEWLPGKALALSQHCWPEIALGPTPNLYPFIVNDPGEGSQAKRRTAAVIIDHLTPPLTRAESYGPLRQLEALVDEYYEASGGDPRRIDLLARQIFYLSADTGVHADAGIASDDSDESKLTKLDAFLCDLKELQIRDGLHVFGESPQGRLRTDLAVALARLPRGDGEGLNASLHRAIAMDVGLAAFDPLDCDMAAPWVGSRPETLRAVSDAPWRIAGDTVERIELLAAKLVAGEIECPPDWKATSQTHAEIRDSILSKIDACGAGELWGLLTGLDGRFVAPGPSGAPSRGRLDVLPTGRNFYSVDSRAVPTPAAYELGRRSAELLIVRYRQDHGEWPTSFGLSAWGTSNMRTGGDDIAQAMALIGARPLWELASRRVTGYEILTLAELGRPRVDVTLRISGFFRDAFPVQIELFDKAIRAIGALEEEASDNPIATRMRYERTALLAKGIGEDEAMRRAGFRIFGSRPGAYGAGLQALIDEKGWDRIGDLAEAYIAWGHYAYGDREEGTADEAGFRGRLAAIEAVVHNQDNREHDLLDSDDYYQFEGGMAATAHHLTGKRPAVYHNDHSRPERPVVRALEEEIARVVRGRAANPKWIAGVMRHGYKGAFEMAATLDYLFAFAATTGAVRNAHFDLVYEAWIGETEVREFIARHNPAALKEMADRFLEAIRRGMWTPRSNSAKFDLEKLAIAEAGDDRSA